MLSKGILLIPIYLKTLNLNPILRILSQNHKETRISKEMNEVGTQIERKIKYNIYIINIHKIMAEI